MPVSAPVLASIKTDLEVARNYGIEIDDTEDCTSGCDLEWPTPTQFAVVTKDTEKTLDKDIEAKAAEQFDGTQ